MLKYELKEGIFEKSSKYKSLNIIEATDPLWGFVESVDHHSLEYTMLYHSTWFPISWIEFKGYETIHRDKLRLISLVDEPSLMETYYNGK